MRWGFVPAGATGSILTHIDVIHQSVTIQETFPCERHTIYHLIQIRHLSTCNLHLKISTIRSEKFSGVIQSLTVERKVIINTPDGNDHRVTQKITSGLSLSLLTLSVYSGLV